MSTTVGPARVTLRALPAAAVLSLLALPSASAALAAGHGDMSASAPAFRPQLCPPGVFPESARVDCGSVTVPEDHARPDGRKIEVAAAVVHAPAARAKPDPIVFLDGGPSFGAISPYALGAYFAGAGFVEDRDLILVDTRGTGISEPRLGCPEFDRADESTFYSKPFIGSSFVEDFTALATV
jgi:hypothetical protein